MDASPAKRRVLGAIDPNTCSPKVFGLKQPALGPVKSTTLTPERLENSAALAAAAPLGSFARTLEREPGSRKRRSTISSASSGSESSRTDEPAPKRTRHSNTIEDAQPRADLTPHSPPSSSSTVRTSRARHGSASPDAPSVFDTSAADNTQSTILTEPDTAGGPPPAAPPAPRPRLTREQAREKAEIIRLRLGLASYKVRTGQTDVPLETLEMRRLLGSRDEPTGAARDCQDESRRNATAAAEAPRPMSSASASSAPFAAAAGGSQKRKPLPAAAPALRRASSGGGNGRSSVSAGTITKGDDHAAAAAAAVTGRYGRTQVDTARPERTRPEQNQRHHQRQHARLDSGDDDRRDDSQLSRRSSADSAAPFHTRSSSLATADDVGEGPASGDDDDGRRGGAASGLLSLARS